MMEQAFDQISDALQEGELVCIFPEGKITANGENATLQARRHANSRT